MALITVTDPITVTGPAITPDRSITTNRPATGAPGDSGTAGAGMCGACGFATRRLAETAHKRIEKPGIFRFRAFSKGGVNLDHQISDILLSLPLLQEPGQALDLSLGGRPRPAPTLEGIPYEEDHSCVSSGRYHPRGHSIRADYRRRPLARRRDWARRPRWRRPRHHHRYRNRQP